MKNQEESAVNLDDRLAKKKARRRSNYEKNKEFNLEKTRLWKINNPEKNAEQKRRAAKTFRERHPERAANIARQTRLKIKQDPVRAYIVKMRDTLKNTIRAHLKKAKFSFSDNLIRQRFGCSADELIDHITKNLLPGMSWENYGEWVVARIEPFANAQTIQDVERLAHYTNCQPVWLQDNLKRVGGLRRKITSQPN